MATNAAPVIMARTMLLDIILASFYPSLVKVGGNSTVYEFTV
ncbi:hypothetical protein SAMCFNEI73_pB0320 (plasmid) [Sinorhizobium americanum]|uniref:Uncharacterized protein n=1 Tax=Sinorhizobium americanum TaxID=194963 RepID=A0A1L3LTW5_9HYPH|nr:hypothetical protein SAMCFNEI73_pB0320 [Sinorhizobium americanum]